MDYGYIEYIKNKDLDNLPDSDINILYDLIKNNKITNFELVYLFELFIERSKNFNDRIYKLIYYLIKSEVVKIDKIYYNGDTYLLKACKNGNVNLVKILLKFNNKNINDYNRHGQNPLHDACNRGNIEIVKLLIENGADVNNVNRSCISPLYTACDGGNLEIVKLLIENGAKNFITFHRILYCPFNLACENEDLEILKLLMSNKEKNNLIYSGSKCLYISCKKRNLEILKFLIDNGANINSEHNGHDLLSICFKNKPKFDIIKFLIDNNININNLKFCILSKLVECFDIHLCIDLICELINKNINYSPEYFIILGKKLKYNPNENLYIELIIKLLKSNFKLKTDGKYYQYLSDRYIIDLCINKFNIDDIEEMKSLYNSTKDYIEFHLFYL